MDEDLRNIFKILNDLCKVYEWPNSAKWTTYGDKHFAQRHCKASENLRKSIKCHEAKVKHVFIFKNGDSQNATTTTCRRIAASSSDNIKQQGQLQTTTTLLNNKDKGTPQQTKTTKNRTIKMTTKVANNDNDKQKLQPLRRRKVRLKTVNDYKNCRNEQQRHLRL